jgi:CDP-diacylglycerol--serine O-phosphatidyltransferase
MKNSNYILPNALTLLNLLCGSAAIIFLFESPHEQPYAPVLLLVLAAVFDVFDGLTAKLLHATSEFGKQLDSLADLISFGLAPAVMMYHLLILSFVYQSDTADFLIETASVGERLILYSSLLILVFAALRLARFNVTTHIGSDFYRLACSGIGFIYCVNLAGISYYRKRISSIISFNTGCFIFSDCPFILPHGKQDKNAFAKV